MSGGGCLSSATIKETSSFAPILNNERGMRLAKLVGG